MKSFWNWLNGKKTVIGGVLTLLIGFLQAKLIIDADTAFFLLSLTGLLLGVGISHKIVKAKKIEDGTV